MMLPTSTVPRHQRSPLFSLANISVIVQLWIKVFWVISVQFDLRNTLPKFGPLHPVYCTEQHVCISKVYDCYHLIFCSTHLYVKFLTNIFVYDLCSQYQIETVRLLCYLPTIDSSLFCFFFKLFSSFLEVSVALFLMFGFFGCNGAKAFSCHTIIHTDNVVQ